MKQATLTDKVASTVVIFGYLAALFCVIIGLQLFLQQRLDFDLIAGSLTLAITVITFVLKITGWTILGFLPVGIRMAQRVKHAISQRRLHDHHRHEVMLLSEIAIGIGMLGTVWAFISTAMMYAQSGAGDPQSTLMSILMGLSSTFTGLLIGIAGLILMAFFPPPKQSSQQ